MALTEGMARDDWLSESSPAQPVPLPRPPGRNSWNGQQGGDAGIGWQSPAGWGEAAQLKHLPVQVSQEEVKRRKQEAGGAGSVSAPPFGI